MPKKFLISLVLLSSLIGSGFLVHAQLSESAYQVKTVNIFPAQIEAVGWSNKETLTFQNLDNYALLQDFNQINSTYLDVSRQNLLEDSESDNVSNEPDETNATNTNEEENDSDDTGTSSASETSDDEETATSSNSTTTGLSDDDEATSTDSADQSDDLLDPAVASSSASNEEDEDVNTGVNTTTDEEVEPEPETEEEENKTEEATSTGESSTTTVLRRVGSAFALAVDTVTSFFDGSTSTESGTTSEEVDDANETNTQSTTSEDEVTTTEETGSSSTENEVTSDEEEEEFANNTASTDESSDETTSTTASSTDAQNNTSGEATSTDETSVAEEVSTTTSTSEETEPTSDTTTEDSTTDETASSTEPCEDECKEYVIHLSDFGFPIDEGVDISGAQLRLSLAAKKKSTREKVPDLDVRYSADGGNTWQSAGSIEIADEISNSINGGYYLFALSDIASEEDLQQLEVKLVYDDDPALLEELYVESAWLEMFTLEPPETTEPLDTMSLLEDDGYENEPLSGDTLTLPNGKEIEFNFTDNNEDETLIIKTDQEDYLGLSQTNTYFSVTNTSDNVDEFTLQTYFPEDLGKVESIKEFKQNKPKQVTVPEYRPFVYHCEAGWEYAGEVSPDSLEDLSRQFADEVRELETANDNIQSTTSTSSEVEFDVPSSTEQSTSSEPLEESMQSTNTTSTALRHLNSVSELLQFSTTSATGTEPLEDAGEDGEQSEDLVDSYVCRNTNFVRTCDSVEGDNTACKVNDFKVNEHKVTKYVSGWEDSPKTDGRMPEPNLLKRMAQLVGFGPDRKDVPEEFEARTHSAGTYEIQPGETKYFKMDISFPAFSSGEYWIEAVGDSEYGLLDPFWSSQWDYRLPITIDNTANDRALDEDQVFLELDSSLTDFWSKVNSDGSDMRFVYEEPGNVDDWYGVKQPDIEWYDRDWGRRAPITIQSSQVDSTLADFPVYVDLSTLGDDFFSNLQADGADIRVTTDDGETEVPFELVDIDTGAGTGELYFKASTLSNSSDTTFYIYHDNSSATSYAESDTYGAENVWTNGYEAVYHMSDLNDSTANGRDTSAVGSPTQVDGAYDLGGDTDYLEMPSNFSLFSGADSFTWQVRFEADAVAPDTNYVTSPVLLSMGAENNTFFTFGDGEPGDTIGFRYEGWTTPVVANNIGLGVDYLLTMSYDQPGADMRMYLNGTETDSSAGTISAAGGAYPGNYIGGLQTSEPDRGFDGRVDEVRILSNPLSANWVSAENTNLYTPATFYSTSTNETVPELEEIGEWSYRQPLTIQASEVDATLTDFAVYVDLSNFGSDFFDQVKSDGADIRVTTDDGLTEIPYELTAIDTGSKTGQLHFKAPSISDTDDTTFYVYYGNQDAESYSASSEFGSDNVWNNGHIAVYHLEEDEAGIGNDGLYKDVTGNGHDGDDNVVSTGKTGKLGLGQEINARSASPNTDEHILLPSDAMNGVNELVFSFWLDTSNTGDQSIIGAGASNELIIFLRNTQLALYDGGSNVSFDLDTSVIGTGWKHFVVVRDASSNQWNLYIDGQPDDQNPLAETMDALSVPNDCTMVGGEQDGSCLSIGDSDQNMDGFIDELRLRGLLSEAEIAAEFSNQSDPTSFYSLAPSEELSPTRLNELDFWLQHFDNTNDEADVWVQISDIAANATGTIYMYYGSSGASSDSDPYAPFTYSSPREHYFVVNGNESSDIDIYSLIDDNEIVVNGSSTQLDRGESMILSGYNAETAISALGPITSFNETDDTTEPLVPVSFASTTHVFPSNRNSETFHVYSPWANADVDIYDGGGGSPGVSQTVAAGTTSSMLLNVGTTGIVESTEPILLLSGNDGGDSIVSYPPTMRDLYGHANQDYFFSTAETSGTVDESCSGGSSSSGVTVNRGDQAGNSTCPGGADGAGNAVRLHNQTAPISAIAQRDTDGVESSVFITEPEMATEYILAGDTNYVSIVCSPRFGAVDIELQNISGSVLSSGTCTPNSASEPGTLLFDGGNGDALSYTGGTFVVSTGGEPFWLMYEDSTNDDENNTWGAVQARTFTENEITTSFGAEELAIDAQYEQMSYRWYENEDAQTPTTSLATEGEALADELAIDNGENLRLRMNVRANNATGTLMSTAFSLQYAEAETCNLATEWHDMGDIGSTTAAFVGYNNASVADGNVLNNTLLSQSSVAGTYEEENYSSFIQTQIGMGEIAEWDWSLEASNANSNTTYCFRMIRASDEEFVTYSDYAQLETAGPPLAPEHLVYFDNEKTPDNTPALEFAALDTTGDDIHYQVQVSEDVSFASTDIDQNSENSFLAFENLNNSSDKAPFSSGARIRFTAQSALSDNTTYWWRVRALDPSGSDTWGEWSTPDSFTTDSLVAVSEWHQTTGDQFSTNNLTSLSTSSGAVSVSGSSGSMYSTPIEFGDATVGNAWGEVYWNDTETSGDIAYQVEYYDGSTWSLVPDSFIPNNSSGIGNSPINLLGLDTVTYETIRLVASFSGSSLSIQDWGVRWGQRVGTPKLITPFDHEKVSTSTPTFSFVSTDPEGDDVEYQLSYDTDSTFTSSTTVTTGPFASGATTSYTILPGDALTNNSTYWWRVRSKDPSGGDAWSPWSLPDSFTVDDTVSVSTWFQTTQEQFHTGTLDGLEAVDSDEVEVSSRIGEYGTVTLNDGVWTEVNTNRSYNDMVVVGSPEYASDDNNARTVRIRNKGEDSFEILVDNFDSSLSGVTSVDYLVMESGTWQIEEGGSSVQVVAGTADLVSEVKSRSYSDAPGTEVVFPTPFNNPPAALASVSSDHDSTWVGTHVDDGNNSGAEATVNDMYLSLARSFESAVHDPEDIDYIAFDVGDGTNDGVEFESFNSPDSVNCCNTGSAVNYQTAFATEPAVTVVHMNGADGGDGGFAVKDLQTPSTASTIYLEVPEMGSGANAHTNEVVSVVAFEDTSGFIVRDTGSGGDLNGSIRSEAIEFSDGAGPKFEQIYWNDTTPGASTVSYQIEHRDPSENWSLVPDADLPNNSAGTTTGPIDLSDLDVTTYDVIRLVAQLECDSSDCPTLQDWTLEWSEGVTMSGTLKASDLSTDISTGTVRVAVNGTLLDSTGSVSNGAWSINNVTAFAGDTVTVFVDGAEDNKEAANVFVYDGTGNMTGVELFEQHLSFSSDENATTTNAALSAYDYSVSGNEDIFFDVDGSNELTTCAVGSCSHNSLYIGSSNVYQPDSAGDGDLETHSFINNGVVKLNGNTMRVSGDWTNNSTFTPDTSTVIFSATSTNLELGTWYDEAWSYRVPVTIDAASVDSNLTDFPVYVDLSNLPTAFFSNVQANGDDIRITQDDEVSEVPFELVSLDTGAETGQLHFKAPSLSSATDTTFYIYYGNSSASGYGVSDTYGRNNVWTNGYEAVYHLDDGDSTASDFYTDATGNGYDGTLVDSNGNSTVGSGQLGQAFDFNGDADYIDTFTDASTLGIDGANQKSISAWAYTESYNDGGPFSLGTRATAEDYSLRTLTSVDNWRVQHWGAPDHDFTYGSQNQWVHFALDYDGAVTALYADGVDTSNEAATLNTTNTFDLRIGSWHDTDFFDGQVDEVRIATTSRSSQWYDAEYTNQNTPTSFYTVGSETDVPLVATSWELDDASGILTFNNLTFGENVSVASWELLDAVDVNGSLSVNQGTLDRSERAINVATNLTTGSNGQWQGLGTTTFDGSVTSSWTDNSSISQNIGKVVVDGSAKTVNVTSDVLAESITIGENDTLGGGGAYDIEIQGDFTNNNSFIPATSRLVVVGTSTNATIDTGGSNLYGLSASSTGGSVSFTESTITLVNNLEIATGTINLPTTRMQVGGSLLNTGGVLAHNNAEVRFTSSGAETIELNGTEFLNNLYDVRFTGSGDWSFTDANATTTNTFVIDNGSVTLPSENLTVGRNFETNAPGSFLANGGEVTLLSRSTDPITTNGSAFNHLRIREGSPIRGGGFSADWSYRDVITIQASAVDAELTDFPVYLDLSDFDSNFFNNINSDGGDIRITTADGVTEVPREVVSASTTAETGEVYFKAPSLSSSTNSTFYIYYGNATATDYAIDATYGAENVWDDDFLAVYHMEELNPLDSTSFDRDASASGDTPSVTDGRFGSAVSIVDNGGSDYIDLNSNLSELSGGSEMSVSAWVNVTDDSNDDVIFTRELTGNNTPILLWDNISGNEANDTYTFNVGDTGDQGNRVDAQPTGIAVGDTWQYVVGSMQGQNRYIYVDGVIRNTDTTASAATIPSNTVGSAIGYWGGSGNFDYDGLVDEYRISRVERSANWIKTEHLNMSTSSDFYSITSGGADPVRIMSDTNTEVAGDFVIESGEVQLPTGDLEISGSFTNNNAFYAGTGAVVFNANSSGHTISSGDSNFYDLEFNGAGGGWTIGENATATNSINLTAGDALTIDNGVVLESSGTFFNDMLNVNTTWTGATLRLSGDSDFSINNKTSDGDDYDTLLLTDDIAVQMWNSSAVTYDLQASSSVYSQDHDAVDGDLYIYGDYVRATGTEHWSYDTDFDGTDLSGGSERQANVRVAGGASLLFATSTLSMTGDAGASTTVNAQSGSYSLTAQGATVTASYLEMGGADSNGLNLTASTTVGDFDDTRFTIPDGTSGITVDASTVDSNPTKEILNTAFTSVGGSWYSSSWSGRVPITIQASEVEENVTDFPVYVDLSDFDATFFSSVRSDGGDIRVTAGDATTELSREVVAIDTGAQTGELYFKADSLSASSDTTFYIYFGNSSATDYATGATYGSQSVWSNDYEVVYHFTGDPSGGTPQYVDSTGNSTGSAINMEAGDAVSSPAGQAAYFDGVDEYIETTYDGSLLNSTWQVMVNADGLQDACDGVMFSRGTNVSGLNLAGCQANDELGYHWNDDANSWGFGGGPVYPTNEWFMASMSIDPSTATLRSFTGSGVSSGANSITHNTSVIDNLNFAQDTSGGRFFSGTLDEARLSSVVRSENWLSTEYNNLSSAGTFYTAASSETNTSATNVTLTGTPDAFWWFRDGSGNRYGEAYDADDGDPGAIRWDDSSYEVDISGVVYADDGSTPLGNPTCDGSTPNLRIVVDGGDYTDTTSCSAADGSYTFTNVSYIGDPNIVVYLDTDGGENGSVITKTPTDDISGLDIYANRVMTRHESAAPLTITDMVTYDETNDTDLRFVVTTGTPNSLTVRPDTELMVASGTTFKPEGEITLQSGGSGQSYDGSLHLGEGATFTASGTESHSVGGSFFNEASSTFHAASSTFAFTATTSGQGITKVDTDTLDFHELQFTGAGGSWNLTADITVADDMTVSNGTVSGTGDITIASGSLSGNGVLSMGGGTTTLMSSNTLGGSSAWTFNDLVLGDGATVGTTTRAQSATTTIGGTLVIDSAHYLDTGSSVWDLAGSGEVMVEDGTLLQDTSTFVYSGGTGANVLSTNYYNLTIGGWSGTPTYTFGSTGVLVENDLTVAGGVSSIADLNSNDPVVSVLGDVKIGANGTLSLSDNSALTVSGSYDNNGALSHNGGEMVFNSSDAYTLAAGSSDLADVTLNGSGAATIIENATSTGQFTIASSSDFTLQAGTVLAVGEQLSLESSNTDWSGSTLYLYGGDYTLNSKGQAETLENLVVGENAEIRTWDMTANNISVDSGGSLYSQDHEGLDGDLYVYGTYQEETRSDYWSYATDFDGTDLSGGSERQAEIYFADGASATWSGGSIELLGTAGASTTVQNQGTGDYALTIGGNTTADWQYGVVRNINSDGITFTGSPTVNAFDDIDLLAETNGATTMTVGGSAISASPAKTFSRVIFNSDVGVTGAVNVTATGTTQSGWRLTDHLGNLDGEENDDDPEGDPGYIIWDDSDDIISISGNVYEADGSTVSSVCDDSTTNIVLSIAGSVAQNASSSCSSADGSYTISGVSFGSLDELMIYIDGESRQGITVSKDPISSIADMDIYENHVTLRHENTAPMTIADLAVWDSSDDADIPYTAVTAPNTLNLPANTKLLVWNNKEFAPGGDMTIAGGGAGAAYDGSFEALDGATFTPAAGETHSIGGSFEFGSGSSFAAGSANVVMTTPEAGRTISVGEDEFYDLTFNGSGSWLIDDAETTVNNDLTISAGTVTLSTATTTVGGSFVNNGGFNANSGTLHFTSDASENITFGGSDVADVLFAGGGSWSITDTNATATQSFRVATGSVTMPSGVMSVAGDFVVNDTLSHNNGELKLTNGSGVTTLTLSGNDLATLRLVGAATTEMTDASAALSGSLYLEAGSLNVATDTLSVGGSLDATGGTMDTASGTILFNSSDSGEVVNPGSNDFYNVIFAGSGSAGWELSSATTTNNFSLTNANDFTLSSGETLVVNGVFLNTVGGSATDWSNTTLLLDGAKEYSINNRTSAGDNYENLIVGADSDIKMWHSVATSSTVDPTSSLYSQDHSGADGELFIYGDFTIGTTTEYWNYENDFDGTSLAGASRRPVTVSLANGATTTVFDSGSLEVKGDEGATTTVQSQDSGSYTFSVEGGYLDMNYYALRDMNDQGLQFSGSPNITSLSNGDYELNINGGNLITLDVSALDANPSLQILNTRFATTPPASTGVNVDLSATTTNNWTFRYDYGNLAGENYDVDGVTDCGSIRWGDSSCLLTEQTEYRWRYDDGGIGVPDSEWFDTDWDKRKRLRVKNNDSSDRSNYAVKVTVDYDSNMQNDFDDLRFTESDGVTEVDYWVEEFDSGVSADVWVKVPSLIADETAQLFMYYDNSGATTTSSSTATLIASDDFEDDDISEYSGDTGFMSTGATFAYGGSYGLDLGSNQGTRLTDGIARFDQPVSQGETIRYMQYVDTSAGSSDEACTLFGVQSPVTTNQNYGVCLELFGTNRISLAKDVESTDSYGGVELLATSTVSYTTGWYEVEIDWKTDNTFAVKLFNPSGSLVATTSATDATYTSGGFGFTSWGQNGGWDSFTSRPIDEADPATFFGAEQTAGGASYAAEQNTPTSVFGDGDTARLRVAIENSGLAIEDQEFTIEYAAKGSAASCAAVAGSVYDEVPTDSACGSSEICMATSTTVSNGETTTDLLAVDDNEFTAGSFVEDPSNVTSALDLDQNHYTELEYTLNVTDNVSEQNYCFRVTDNGTAYDSYVNIPELTLKFDPVINSITLNNGEDISLVPGTTTTVYATGTVTDLNGFADLELASSTIYRSGVSGGASCSEDNNDCYVSTSGQKCEFTDCVGNSCTVQCVADMFFHADATDAGSDYEGEEWLAFIEVEDAAGGYDFASALGVEVSTLRAIDVEGMIDYGALSVNSDTGSYNASTSVLNQGNVEVNLEVAGTDLSDGANSVIPANNQKFATSTFTYGSCGTCADLSSTSPVQLDVDLTKPTVEAPPIADDVFWGIAVPFGINSAAHQGINVFTPVSP